MIGVATDGGMFYYRAHETGIRTVYLIICKKKKIYLPGSYEAADAQDSATVGEESRRGKGVPAHGFTGLQSTGKRFIFEYNMK